MAGRRRRTQQTVSLFPFLSILACVIGVLTLLITALALGQMDRQQGEDVVRRADEAENIRNRVAANQAKLKSIESQLEDEQAIRGELARATEELKRLQQELESRQQEADDNHELRVELLAEADRLRERIKQQQANTARSRKEIERLQAELNERLNPEEPEVQIRPSGTGVDLDPTFVECTASGVVIHEGSDPQRVPTSELNNSPAFLGLLERVSQQPKGTVIFLIRSDGLGTYHRAGNIAKARYCRNGKLPVIGQGRIDLSIFHNNPASTRSHRR